MELISDVSLTGSEGSNVGVGVAPSFCDIDEGGNISPFALISVVGDIGAGALNSKAR